MNDFFYETRGKEKIKELQNEGQRSQSVHRSGIPKASVLSSLPKVMMGLLGVLAMLGLLMR